MELNTKNPLLKFDPAQKKLTQSLSAALFVGDRLWVASDELTSVERLSTDDGLSFRNHKSFPLDGLIKLPAAGTDFDQEIDIEGLDFHDSYLWLVGSHSLKRKNVKADDKGAEEKLIKKLGTVEQKGNRFVLARVPLVSDSGEQELRSPAEDPLGSGRILTASHLPSRIEGNTLTDAIKQADSGKGDAHLAKSLDIPGKDNGFDIEGIAVVGDRVFLGLRGPVLRGWAVILELAVETSDPSQLMLREFEATGRPYRKHFLDLNGLGIRDLCLDGAGLLILAGPTMNLDGPTAVYRWKDIAKRKDDSLVRGADLARILEIPFGQGTDHAEGFTIIPGAGQPHQILVVYDSPSEERTKEGAGTVRVDIFELPH